MSTPCSITYSEYEVYFYHDGYPSWMLRHINAFIAYYGYEHFTSLIKRHDGEVADILIFCYETIANKDIGYDWEEEDLFGTSYNYTIQNEKSILVDSFDSKKEFSIRTVAPIKIKRNAFVTLFGDYIKYRPNYVERMDLLSE